MKASQFVKYAICFSLLIIFLYSCTTKEKQHFTLTNTHIVQMKSELTGRDHELIIFLPGSYENYPDKEYPVLYFMDAYWDMPLLNSIHGQLVYDNVLPELIMVGFSYPGEDANYGELRARDLTPTKVGGNNSTTGDGPKFLKFIEETVIPYINSNFRTKKGERAISGNSLGGLFTLYVMYEKPELFNRFISISPAVDWDSGYMFKIDEAYAEKSNFFPVRLFLSQGGDEYEPFRQPIVKFQEALSKRNYKDMALLNYTIEGERHSGVKSEGYSRGLRWVFKDIAPTGPSGLEKEMTK
ncbi:MAG: alpha/beta hydrolase-fold protein [Calditrichaceae bacterium]